MSIFDKALGAEVATNNYNRKAKKTNRQVKAVLNDYEKVINELQNIVNEQQSIINNLEKKGSFQNAEINRLKDKANDLITSRQKYIDENQCLKKQLNK